MTFNKFQYQDLLARQDDLYAGEKYKIILSYLKNGKNLKILNAGCGSGELSFLLAAAGHRVVGFDPSLEYIELARRNAARNNITSCSFEVGSIEDFSSMEGYDCVVATDVLEHIKDDRTAAIKLVNLVRPGGVFIITVPALPSLFGFHDEMLGHFRRYTKASLTRLMRSVEDITLEKLRYFGYTLIPIVLLYSKIWRKTYPVAVSGKGLGATIRQSVLRLMLFFDHYVPAPFGTSLIFYGKKRNYKDIV